MKDFYFESYDKRLVSLMAGLKMEEFLNGGVLNCRDHCTHLSCYSNSPKLPSKHDTHLYLVDSVLKDIINTWSLKSCGVVTGSVKLN